MAEKQYVGHDGNGPVFRDPGETTKPRDRLKNPVYRKTLTFYDGRRCKPREGQRVIVHDTWTFYPAVCDAPGAAGEDPEFRLATWTGKFQFWAVMAESETQWL